MPQGTLTVVGTGYRVAGQATRETCAVVEAADRLLYLVSDPATAHWLRSLNPGAQSLHDCYRDGRDGLASSQEMVERILAPLHEGLSVCAAFYGHPAIFMHPPHEAMRRARLEGFGARMLPAVSSVDCLFADLGVDPATDGYRLFEATDFLVRRRTLDLCVPLVLLQVGAVANIQYRSDLGPNPVGLRVLTEVLLDRYPADHEVVLYEIGQFPPWDPLIRRVPLAGLTAAPVSVVSTLFVPRAAVAPPDPGLVERLRGVQHRPA